MDLWLNESAFGFSVIDRVLLQLAFTGLVADWAIQWMVDQQKLEHSFAHLLYGRSVCVDFHAGRNRSCTGNGWARCFRDFCSAIGIDDRLPVRTNGRSPKLNEAHAAIAGDR